MKNNFITKIIGATLAFAMMIGGAVGINAAKEAKEVNADAGDITVTWIAQSGDLGEAFTSFTANGTKTGTITTSSDSPSVSYDWAYTRTYKSGTKDTCAFVNATGTLSGGKAIQLGQNGGVENLHLETSDIPGVIKTISIYCASYQGKHNISVSVGGTSYISSAVPAWGSGAVSEKKNTTLGTSQGEIEIDFTGGTRALYISSISVTYGEAAPENSHTVTFNTNGGSSISGQNVVDSESANKPDDPTRRGFNFVNWYDNSGFNGEPYDFNTPVTDDLTLFAKWEKVNSSSSYSPSLSNGEYRVAGEVIARTGTSDFYIQSGSNVMKVNSNTYASSVKIGNDVDLFGTYTSGNDAKFTDLAYCDVVDADDLTVSQQPLTDLENVTSNDVYKYFSFARVKLTSAFNNRTATIYGSNAVVYYQAASFVNYNYDTGTSSFAPANYGVNDYVTIRGVIILYNSTIELLITHIEKMTSYVVTFDSNEGTSVASQTILAGEQVERPTDPTRASDEQYNYAFAGWYDNPEFNGDVYDFDSAVNSSFTLYAKWDRTELEASQAIGYMETRSTLTYRYSNSTSTPTDSLNREFTGIDNDETSYSNWSNKNGTSNAIYAGNSAGSNNSIQLRSNNSNSGIVTTTSGGEAKTITVVWNSGTTDGRKLDIYGKSTAYTAATDLYNNSNQGTKLGTITCGTNTSLTISGSYTYIGLRSASGAMYLDSIEIEWEKTTYTYSNVGIRYGGLISTALWNRLNAESTIEGYGVVFSTITNWTDDQLSDYIGEADNASVWNFYTPLTSKAHPDYANSNQKGDTEEEYYVWSLFKNVSAENTNNFKVSYTGVAYIKTAAGYVFFKQTVSSVKSLATGLLATSEYNENSLEGSLYNLANL